MAVKIPNVKNHWSSPITLITFFSALVHFFPAQVHFGDTFHIISSKFVNIEFAFYYDPNYQIFKTFGCLTTAECDEKESINNETG